MKNSEIVKSLCAYYTAREISAKTGYSRQQIYNLCKSAGLEIKPSPPHQNNSMPYNLHKNLPQPERMTQEELTRHRALMERHNIWRDTHATELAEIKPEDYIWL